MLLKVIKEHNKLIESQKKMITKTLNYYKMEQWNINMERNKTISLFSKNKNYQLFVKSGQKIKREKKQISGIKKKI